MIDSVNRRQSLSAIFARFLRFGLLAWGGPVAQVAIGFERFAGGLFG